MDTQLARNAQDVRASGSRTALVVSALGPLTVLGGIAWAIAQPWRITLLHPHGQGFWWLVVEPPLLVVAVGLAFALLIAPGVVEDLAAAQAEKG